MWKTIKNHLTLPVIITMAMLLLQYPYILIYFFPFIPGEAIIVPFFIILTVFVILAKSNLSVRLPSIIVCCMITQAIGWAVFYMLHNDTSYLSRNIFMFLSFTNLLMLVKLNSLGRFLSVNHWWMCIQSIGGAVAFVFVFVGFLQPLLVILPDDHRIISFYGITCSNSVVENFIRAGGFFDEPGALACWGIFCLLLNKLTFDNRKIELFMLISLIFTFSAAYFVLVTMYLVLFYATKLRNSIVYVSMAIILMGGVFYILRDNEHFKYMTTERFEDGQIRSKREIAEEAAKVVYNNHKIIGVGARNLERIGETTSDNPYEILAKDGIIGYIITYLPLVFLIVKYRTKSEVIFSSLILMASYMQRPFHINEMHYFMLYLFMLIIETKYNYEYKFLIDKT